MLHRIPMDDEERPSKTQRKHAMHELQSLGEQLVRLNAAQIDQMNLPETLLEAVLETARIKSHEGRRRHMQYIGKLMREVDPEPIREQLAAWAGSSRQHTAREHEISRWRDRLLEEEDAVRDALTEFAGLHPRVDLQRIRVLARNARAERDAGRAPKSYRELYRALREAMAQDAPVPVSQQPEGDDV